MFKFLQKILKNAIFYDRWTCNVCGSEIFFGFFCDECLKKIEYIGENKCNHCGRKTVYKTGYCESCIDKNISFNTARSVFNYKSPISEVIQNFKYSNKRYLSRYFAEELFKIFKAENLFGDVITYVPMHESRLKERGFNQAYLIAKEFSTLCKTEVKELVKKVKETERQAKLSYTERLKNLKSSFKVTGDVSGKNVILIDDVLTTGATVDTISNLLKKKGAKNVTVLTVASVQRNKQP